jgi:glycosyltransferase involved in cell wall biosynthesis
LKIVRKKYPNFQFSIMGEGDIGTKERFKKKIEELGLRDNVHFLGYRNGLEKYNIIKSAKCFWFLSVSRSENFGVALLEAVCSGIPAFVYNLPQFPRIYQNHEVDVSPMGDYKAVAEKVIKLFESGEFSNEKGKKLIDKYSWEQVAETEYNAIKNL